MQRLTTPVLAGLLGVMLVLAWLPREVMADGNGIQHPSSGAVVSGQVEVRGAADHPQFLKWQLDLLPARAAEQAMFLALGEQQAPRPAAQTPARQPAVPRVSQLGLPTRSADGAPTLYLTFDDGPNPVLTPQLGGITPEERKRNSL